MGNRRNFTHNSNFFFQTNLFGEDFTYNIQECNLPGMNFSHIQTSKSSVFGNIEGDTITYNDLIVNIIIDEELKIWKEIVNVMQTMRNPITSKGELIERYGFLIIQDDNTNEILKLEFSNMMVETIDDLSYNTNSEDDIITCSVTIKYDTYIIL